MNNDELRYAVSLYVDHRLGLRDNKSYSAEVSGLKTASVYGQELARRAMEICDEEIPGEKKKKKK